MRLTLNNHNVAVAKRKICIVQKRSGRTQTFLDFMKGRAFRDFEKIVKLDTQSNDPSHLSVIEDSNSLGHHFSVGPKGGMLSPFSLEINHSAGAPAPRINAGVDPNRGEVFISPENQTQGQSSTTVSISPFALEIPPFPSSCAMDFAPISQFTKPSQWEKFPGGNIADRFKFWFLNKIPLPLYASGTE